jgi:hypothetical protein
MMGNSIKSLACFKMLSDEDIEDLLMKFTFCTTEKDSYLYEMNQASGCFYIISSGKMILKSKDDN